MNAPSAPAVTQDVVMRTTKIFAHEPIDWQTVVEHFQSLPRLQTLMYAALFLNGLSCSRQWILPITYRWHLSPKCGARWERYYLSLPIPTSILRPNIQFFILDFHAGYDITVPKYQQEVLYHMATSNLVYFKIPHIPAGVLLQDFAKLLAKCKNMRALSCRSDQYRTFYPLQFDLREVMPPLTKLYLRNCFWSLGLAYNASHWNFAHLETLEIIHSMYFLLLWTSRL
jgi:hypothetical protein